MYIIRKSFEFSAKHALSGLPEGHQCARDHGHNYVVTVELSSTSLNEVGFVKDYGELKPIKEYIDSTFDHRDLNAIFTFNPTAENMAKFFFEYFRSVLGFKQLRAVDVSETPKTVSRYTPDYD